MLFGQAKEFDQQVLATTMMGAVSEVFTKMCSERFTSSPTVRTRDIIEIRSGLRNLDIESNHKFYSKKIISTINLFRSQEDQDRNRNCGFIVIYFQQSIAMQVFHALGFPDFDMNNENEIKDTCGEFCNVISGEFKNQLSTIGYLDLFINPPTTRLWVAPDGVAFPAGLKKYQELSFYLFNDKAIVVDVAMADIPLA